MSLIDHLSKQYPALTVKTYEIARLRANMFVYGPFSEAKKATSPVRLLTLNKVLTDQHVSAYERAEALLVRAKFYRDQGNYQAALGDYEEILEMSEPYLNELRQLAVEEVIPLLWNEANRASKAGDDTTALQLLDRLLKMSCNRLDLQVMVQVNRSFIHLRQQNWPAAIEDCNAVLQAQNSPLDQQLKALVNRSRVYLALKNRPVSNDVEQGTQLCQCGDARVGNRDVDP